MEDLRELQEEVGPGVTILSDPLGEAVRAFGMLDERGVPRDPLARAGTFHVDRDGILRHRWVADAYRERPDPDEVVAALR